MYEKFIYRLLLLRVMRNNAKRSSQDLFRKIFESFPETHLSSLGVKKKEKNLILKDLENIFGISIRGVDREEIITVQDLLTAVYLQLRKNIVP